LYVASGALYVRNVFKKEAKAVMTEMITYIREQFVETLKKIDWMDDTTKRHALEKAKAIHLHMAYPDELFDDQKLEHYYKNVRLDLVLVRATDFFFNL
jgi:membrane metallo-endopeptidase-like protein 1